MLPNDIPSRIRQRHHIDDECRVGLKFGVAVDARYDSANREYVVVANTADVDLDREVVLPKGCLERNGGSMDYFLRNRKIFWSHEYDQLAVGEIRHDPQFKKSGGGWFIRVRMAQTALADDLVRLMEDRMFPGSSIGFMALDSRFPTEQDLKAFGDHDRLISSWHWLETSLTFMPCNPGCHGLADTGTEVALARAVDQRRIAAKSAYVFGLPQRKMMPVRGPIGWRQSKTVVVDDSKTIVLD